MSIFAGLGAIIGLGTSLFGASKEKKAAKKSERAQKAAAELRKRMTLLEYKRRSRELIREEMLKTAEVENSAAILGVSAKDSSVRSGRMQNKRNLTEQRTALNQDLDLSLKMFKVDASAASAEALRQRGQAIANVGGSIGNFIGSF